MTNSSDRIMAKTDGVERIRAERQRQIEQEGFTPEHDEDHMFGELSGAGATYAALAAKQIGTTFYEAAAAGPIPTNLWRWPREWWKPSDDPIRNLEKAGALIAAEIDRLIAQGDRR